MSEVAELRAEAVRREQLQRAQQKLARAAPTSLSAHAALFHRTDDGRPMVARRHHQEWIRILQDRERFRWVVIIAPPGYAKSSWITTAYSTWRVGQTKGRIRMGIVSNNENLATKFGKEIGDAISNERFEQLYGVKPDTKMGWNQKDMWTDGSIDKKNPTIACLGIGGDVQGRRFDEIVLDDPSKWEDVRSEATMNGQRFFVKTTLLERFPPGKKFPDGIGRMVVVMTRWGEADLVEMFRELGFVIVTMPALGYWDRAVMCPVCDRERDPELYAMLSRCEHCDTEIPPEVKWGEDALWPELETAEALAEQREKEPIEFELVKQGDPRAVAGDFFHSDRLEMMPPPDLRELTKAVMYVDTSGGQDRKKGDYFAIGTVALEQDEDRTWIVDIVRDRLGAPDQVSKVIETYRRLRADGLRIEQVCIENKNEGIALFQNLVAQNDERMPLKKVNPEGDKEWRAISLANRVNTGKVAVPTFRNGEPYPWSRNFTLEMRSFPNGKHDDQVDAVVGAYREQTGSGPRIRVLRAGAV